MAQDVRLLSQKDHLHYDQFVAGHPEATVYHTRAWHALLEKSFRYEPCVLVAWRDGEIAGILPLALVTTYLGGRRLVSMPFSHHLRPLADGIDSLTALLEESKRLCQSERCGFVEIRSGELPPVSAGWAAAPGYVNTTMPIEKDETAQMSKLRANTRQQLIQGLRHPDLRIEHREDEPAMHCFASLMAATRRRKGSLTYPAVFYHELWRGFIVTGAAHLELAFVADRCIAAFLTFCHGVRAIYGYSASVEDADALRLRPVNVLMWRGINWARERGASEFDFGTSLPMQTSLIRFKEGWGGMTAPLMYYTWRRPGQRGRAVAQDGMAARLASHVLRRLPQPLFTRLTPYLLRQLG